jgi:hypothetical protein
VFFRARFSVSSGHGLKKTGAEQRNHRHGYDERRQQRQAERESERGKQKLADAEQERHREKVDHIDERCGEHCQLTSAPPCSAAIAGADPISKCR